MDPFPFKKSKEFLAYLENFVSGLPDVRLAEVAPDPAKTAVISVDVINGFCYEGPLASPRVQRIIDPIVDLFNRAWDYGIRNIVLAQDTHEVEAVEFGQFAPHCIRGSSEAEAVPEFKALPFYDRFTIIEKNSIHAGLNTGLSGWVDAHPEIDTYIVVGDCTDLCTHQLAMHLRLDANARQISRRVIIPAVAVDTYDLPVSVAQEINTMPHDADLLHAVFLYHMALNGVEVYCKIV